MPDDHRPAMPQVSVVDDQFGTHKPRFSRSHPLRRRPNYTSDAATSSVD